MSLSDFSYYIHLPWCLKKCPYCDFNSQQVLQHEVPEEAYVDALLADLHSNIKYTSNKTCVSIFFGGGTPSLFSPASIKRVLDAIKDSIAVKEGLEITLEANPGTIEYYAFKDYKDVGINRISLGLQSMDDNQLKAIGRIHSVKESACAIHEVKASFANFNLDLMYGLPEQKLYEALLDLQAIIEFNPTHISWYQLTLEPNTKFYYKKPSLPLEEVIWDIYQAGQKLLQSAGYTRYEVSAYTKADIYCSAHNLNYWQFGDYIGLGAGAHSKITDREHGKIFRVEKIKNGYKYMKAPTELVAYRELSKQDLIFEFMLNNLRLTQGFTLDSFVAKTGLMAQDIEAILEQAEKRGLLLVGETIRASELGQVFLNDLQQMFLLL